MKKKIYNKPTIRLHETEQICQMALNSEEAEYAGAKMRNFISDDDPDNSDDDSKFYSTIK